MFIVYFLGIALACSSVGGSCESNDDCCPDLCSPTSCMQGQCIGSVCLADGNSCQIDCQCCSGACIQNDVNPGTCGIPSLKNGKPWTFTNTSAHALCEGSSCGPGGCSDGNACGVCCPPGQATYCIWYGCRCYCSSQADELAKSSTPSFQTVPIILGTISIALLLVIIVRSIRRRDGDQVPLMN